MKLQIRQERERRNWTQDYVAEHIGITAESVSMLEAGKRRPSYDVLVKLEDLFHMNHRKLFNAATSDNTKEADGNQAK